MTGHSHPYNFVSREAGSTLTVFLPDAVVNVNSDHPHFSDILAGAQNGIEEDELHALADLSVAVDQRLSSLSPRVRVGNGQVYFDGDAVDSSLTDHILRVLEAGTDDWRPLVYFMENLAENPQPHSRDQLYDWLRAHDFTITADGCIVGYKGVRRVNDGSMRSCHSGHAIVDGEPVKGHIPNAVGSLVEMPRGNVAFEPSVACSTGLHVGTYEYAKDYARGAMLKVKVNPRDVVSVPTDAAGEKVRVCRYVVMDVIDAPVSGPIDNEDWDDDEVEEYVEEQATAF